MRALRSVLSLLDERLRGVALTLTLQDATVSPAHDAPLDLARDYPELVARCEDLRLEQVLINLLGNALDAVAGVAAPAIEVTIAVSAATLAVEVRDNGSGIAPDLLPRLFEPFFTTRTHGLGLGLPLCDTLAQRQDGTLTVRNLPAGGVEATLLLPLTEKEVA